MRVAAIEDCERADAIESWSGVGLADAGMAPASARGTALTARKAEILAHSRRSIRRARLTGLNVSTGRRKNRTPVEDFLKKRPQAINNWSKACGKALLQDIAATANLIRNRANARFVSWLPDFRPFAHGQASNRCSTAACSM